MRTRKRNVRLEATVRPASAFFRATVAAHVARGVRRGERSSAIDLVEKAQLNRAACQMMSGDTVRVHVKVREGDKERIRSSRAW
jgi:hypothetical protein